MIRTIGLADGSFDSVRSDGIIQSTTSIQESENGMAATNEIEAKARRDLSIKNGTIAATRSRTLNFFGMNCSGQFTASRTLSYIFNLKSR